MSQGRYLRDRQQHVDAHPVLLLQFHESTVGFHILLTVNPFVIDVLEDRTLVFNVRAEDVSLQEPVNLHLPIRKRRKVGAFTG